MSGRACGGCIGELDSGFLLGRSFAHDPYVFLPYVASPAVLGFRKKRVRAVDAQPPVRDGVYQQPPTLAGS